jgi:hypothetical protein
MMSRYSRGFAPFAAAGGVAVAVALATYLTRSTTRASAGAGKRESLITYLREHLSGAEAAIQVVRRLASTHQGTQDGQLFRQLADEFDQDRGTLRSLLMQLGTSPRSPKRAAGYASGVLLSWVAGGSPGHLSLLRTLEALAIGIQGKRCMWRALQTLETGRWGDLPNMVELESKALRQWDAVEERRRALAVTTFAVLDQRRATRV